MANMCDNLLLVSGDPTGLEAFILKARPTHESSLRKLARSVVQPQDDKERDLDIFLYRRSRPLELAAFASSPEEAEEGVWDADFDEAPLVAFRGGQALDLPAHHEMLLY